MLIATYGGPRIIPPKSSGLSKTEFRDIVCKMLHERLPDISIERAGELTLNLRIGITSLGIIEGTSHLDHFYDECLQWPHRLKDIVDSLERAIRTGINYIAWTPM